MTRDLSALFGHPLPCIVIEEWTGLDGWPEYRIDLLSDDGRKRLSVVADHSAAIVEANAIGKREGLPVADLSKDDYAR